MKLGIPRERRKGERRVAATPETVKQLAALGVEILLEEDAGAAAGYPDLAYSQAGAHILFPGSIPPSLTSSPTSGPSTPTPPGP